VLFTVQNQLIYVCVCVCFAEREMKRKPKKTPGKGKTPGKKKAKQRLVMSDDDTENSDRVRERRKKSDVRFLGLLMTCLKCLFILDKNLIWERRGAHTAQGCTYLFFLLFFSGMINEVDQYEMFVGEKICFSVYFMEFGQLLLFKEGQRLSKNMYKKKYLLILGQYSRNIITIYFFVFLFISYYLYLFLYILDLFQDQSDRDSISGSRASSRVSSPGGSSSRKRII
jgi:hypothetical protein